MSKEASTYAKVTCQTEVAVVCKELEIACNRFSCCPGRDQSNDDIKKLDGSNDSQSSNRDNIGGDDPVGFEPV